MSGNRRGNRWHHQRGGHPPHFRGNYRNNLTPGGPLNNNYQEQERTTDWNTNQDDGWGDIVEQPTFRRNNPPPNVPEVGRGRGNRKNWRKFKNWQRGRGDSSSRSAASSECNEWSSTYDSDAESVCSESSVRSSWNHDKSQNLVVEESPTFSKLPVNEAATSKAKMEMMKKMSMDYNNLKQTLIPGDVIKDFREDVYKFEEEHLRRHDLLLERISTAIQKSSDKHKIKWEAHHQILKLQQKNFMEHTTSVKEKCIDLHKLEISTLLDKRDELMSSVAKEAKMFKRAIPIYAYKHGIIASVCKNEVTIIYADAGYYASSVVPMFLLNVIKDGVIVSCQPNIAMCINNFHYLDNLYGGDLLVGYETENETEPNRNVDKAKILFTTVKKLFSHKDHKFPSYSCIVLQCSLRRSVELDFLLELLRDCVSLRPGFKLVLIIQPPQELLKFQQYFANVGTLVVPDLILPVSTVWKKGDSSHDYIQEIVNTACAIHAVCNPGNVLVFLPSKYDLGKVTESLRIELKKYDYSDYEFDYIAGDNADKPVCNLNPCTKEKRKFFFVTSWAEEMMLPYVSYVIDPGVIKEQIYDPTKGLEFEKLCLISQARSKLRKWLVGRQDSGICFRLYNRQNYKWKLKQWEYSEISMQNPVNILLKMFQFGFNEPAEVNFIDPLLESETNKAMDLLIDAGAIKNNKLTTFGQKIAMLSFAPAYSKLIVQGIDWGYPYESILLVALFVTKESIFFEPGSLEERKRLDSSQHQFLTCQSDTLTFLHVYHQFKLQSYSRNWCQNHCLQFDSLQRIKDASETILESVKHKLKVDIVSEIRLNNTPSYYKDIQELIFCCFKHNLCLYNGHPRSGYSLPTSAGCLTFLHPSSVIVQQHSLPQFIVFTELNIGSRNLMWNVTAVPEDVVKKGIELSTLIHNKLHPFVIEPVGLIVIKNVILGNGGQKLHLFEEQLKNETNSSCIVVEASEEKGSVTVYAPLDSEKRIVAAMTGIIQKHMEDFRNEKETRSLELSRGQIKHRVAVTWQRGALLTDLKMSYKDENVKGIEMENSSSTLNNSSIEYGFELTFPRRHCIGIGYMSFLPMDFAVVRKLLPFFLKIKGNDVEVSMNRKVDNQLTFCNLHRETKQNDLKKVIADIYPVITPTKCIVILEDISENIKDELEIYKQALSAICLEFVPDFNITIKRPKKFDGEIEASIKVTDAFDMNRGAQRFNQEEFPKGMVKAKCIYKSSFTVNSNILQALRPELIKNVEELRKRLIQSSDDYLFKFDICPCGDDYNTGCIKIQSDCLENINALQRLLNKSLDGIVVNNDMIKGFNKLFSHGGHLWLTSLQNQLNIYILEEYKSKSIRLYGPKNSCNCAVKRIQEFLEDVENEVVKQINLATRKSSRKLLKFIIRKYGFNLKTLIETTELRSAQIDVRTAKLTLHGCAESVDKALKAISKLEVKDSKAEDLMSCQEVCVICDSAPLQLTNRLEVCGHLYCAECLQGLIANSQFPVQCCAESCDKELILEDVRKALEYDEEAITELLNRSLAAYIAKNANRFIYCPAPDCSMFYDNVEVRDDKWNCPLCHSDICIKCNVVYHHGYTCEMYQGSKKDPNFSYQVWLETGTRNCKRCPKCNTAIEKNEGCNHMTCITCRAHFCWLCLDAFPDANSVYQHQPYCRRRGTIF